MVFDYKILPFTKEDLDSVSEVRGFPERRKILTRKLKRNRRRTRLDRRKSVREGVIVSLSFQENRRKIRDRRSVSGGRKKKSSDARFVL